MALTFEYKPGMSLVDPWPFTVTRSTANYFIDKTGTLVQAAANTLRDRHYPFGLGSAIRTTLCEPSTVNSLLNSQAWTAAQWVSSLLTTTDNQTAAPDGTTTASKLVPDITNSSQHLVQQSNPAITITANENVAISVFLKAGAYSGARLICVDNGATTAFTSAVDLLTGTFTGQTVTGAGVVIGRAITPLANGWYWVQLWGQLNNSVTTAIFRVAVFNTGAAAGAVTAFAGDTTSGIFGWGAQLERFGAIQGPSTSYIPTTTGVLGRNPDQATTPWPYQTQPLWGYAKMVDLGWTQRADFGQLCALQDAGQNSPKVRLITGSGTAGQNPGQSRFNYNIFAGASPPAQQSAAIVGGGATPVAYDTVELFFRLFADTTTEIQRSINGGAVATGSSSSSDFLDFSAPTLLFLTLGAHVGLLSLKLGFGTAPVVTLAQGAAV